MDQSIRGALDERHCIEKILGLLVCGETHGQLDTQAYQLLPVFHSTELGGLVDLGFLMVALFVPLTLFI